MTNQAQPTDPRHERRIALVQALYSRSFTGEQQLMELSNELVAELQTIENHLAGIDAAIQTHAPKYPLDQIAKTDLAILRVAVYELTIKKTEPTKVIINEAVDLAKEMGSERAFAFVNAVLGAIVQSKEYIPHDSNTNTKLL